MKFDSICLLATTLLVAGTAFTARAQTEGATLTDGDAEFVLYDGEDGSLPTDPEEETHGSAELMFASGTVDHIHQTWWFYRLAGDPREYVLHSPTGRTVTPNTVSYTFDLDTNLQAVLDLNLTSPATGLATVAQTLTISNNGLSDATLSVFHYLDLDLGEGYSVNEAVAVDATTIDVLDNGDPAAARFVGPGATAYEVEFYSDLRDRFEDEFVDDFTNIGLPFGPEDFTGAFQWDLVIPAGTTVGVPFAVAVQEGTTVSPVAEVIAEDCFDGFDNDGDNLADCADPDCDCDLDSDGYDDVAMGGDDCDDTDPNVHPGAPELACNYVDDDCDGDQHSDDVDDDGDGYDECNGDCDDVDPAIHPNTFEVACDYVDNNCDGVQHSDDVDDDGDGYDECDGDCDDADAFLDLDDADGDGDSTCDGDCDDSNYDLNILDADGDGFDTCHDGDCDDAHFDSNPDAAEICDGLDNDCDGALPTDEEDADADGMMECDGDCDDADALTHDGAAEQCDQIDNDCDGVVDEDVDEDLDADGYNACQGDCDNNDADTYPGAMEICDGLDNDCDGALPADEEDADADGVSTCDGDCDDTDEAAWPGNPEECFDGIDNDCDGLIDDEDLVDCDAGDDDDVSNDDDDAASDDDDTGNDCDCNTSGRGTASSVASVLLFGLALFRRRF